MSFSPRFFFRFRLWLFFLFDFSPDPPFWRRFAKKARYWPGLVILNFFLLRF